MGKPNSTLSLESRVSIVEEQVSSELENETVIMHLKDGLYYGLDPVGGRIWELLQASVPLRDICHHLVAEYEVSLEQCERDLLTLVRELEAHHLIRVEEGQPSA